MVRRYEFSIVLFAKRRERSTNFISAQRVRLYNRRKSTINRYYFLIKSNW